MDTDILLQKFLDGELSPDEERKALHLFADDPEIRTLLRYDQRFHQAFRSGSDPSSFRVPEGFSDGVMARISESVPDMTQPPADRSPVRNLGDWLWEPRPVTWRPAYAAAAGLLLIITIALPYVSVTPPPPSGEPPMESVRTVSDSGDRVLLRFIFIDSEAESIEVAGDFNNWEPIPMSSHTVNGEQVWTGMVEITRGQHQYMFVRNGEEWVTDPLAPVQQDDGFGNKNAVISI